VLTATRHSITTRTDWLALRRDYLTASVVGCLFDLYPYKTLAAIWAEKTGVYVPPEGEDSQLLERGRELEDVVARLFSKRHPDWQVTKADEFLASDIRLGASPDFYITDDKGRAGILQTKVVGSFQYRRNWLDGLPPQWIILQCLTESMLADARFGIVGALEIGDFKFDFHEHRIPRHPGAERRIIEATVAFWMAVDSGQMPKPDYRRDKALIGALYPREKAGKVLDWRSDNEMPVLLSRHEQLAAEIKAREDELEIIEARVKERMQDAERALVDGFAITYKQIKRKAYTVKEAHYRQLRINAKAEEGKSQAAAEQGSKEKETS